ncbi:hypothetical protein [Erwinia aphidicola]|uniref:hypothetical protein n=1 Tax=Erwinia aphidicola TaxID=68334 RepID=UPI0030D1B8C6
MAELKAGGWALVVGGKESARLIGHTVELVSLECSNSFVRVAGQPLFLMELQRDGSSENQG